LIPKTWAHDSSADAPARYRRACRYEAFVPDPLNGLKLQISADIAGVVSEAEAAIHNLNSTAKPALRPLARLLLRTESIASSKVEGLQLRTRELARAEARIDSGRDAGPLAREIIANIDAMQLAINDAAAVSHFSIDEISSIHQRLMAHSLRPWIAGRIRTEQNWIGGNDHNPCGADFVPPPEEYVDQLLTDLCAAINDEAWPPLVQAALVHAQFETIHPFEDGNGRTGRALVHVVLHRRGIARDYVPPISVVLAKSRDRYILGLTAFREDRMEAWIEHFATVTATAARLASAYLEAVEQLANTWREKLRALPSPPRADAAAWAIIDELPAHPTISAPVASGAIKRSKPQVYQALETLENAGILIPISMNRRNRSWEAAGLLDLIERLEAAEPPPAQ
jgi:Fic family protein